MFGNHQRDGRDVQQVPSSPETVVSTLYSLISGPAEFERDWTAVGDLFHPGSRLVVAFTHADGRSELKEWTPETFARDAAEDYRNRGGLWEREITSRVERFGSIAHVWSSYESRQGSVDAEPFARGINSVQLLQSQGRWWITSLVFDIEQPHNLIPTAYLEASFSRNCSRG
jgi:hypothetical protein